MNSSSFIYSNIRYYRFVMSLLYKGNYYGRYRALIRHISGKSVTELCFGDTIIADHCKKKGIGWKGIDINPVFVQNAVKKGFDAVQKDICEVNEFPPADTCIISGSLYHFHDDIKGLMKKMLQASPRIIISEPVSNLSDNTGIIGKLAKASATVNGQEQHFRYTEKTLREMLEKRSKDLGFTFEVIGRFSKDQIIVITR